LIPVPFETFQCRRCETAGCQQLPACPAMHSCVATSESDRGLLLDRQQVRRRTLSTAPACMQLSKAVIAYQQQQAPELTRFVCVLLLSWCRCCAGRCLEPRAV
jgi:hypothetical protein